METRMNHWPKIQRMTLVTFLLVFSVPLKADEFEGASGLVEKLNALQPRASGTPSSSPSSQDTPVEFLKDLKSFTARSSSLAPEEAAQAWLALLDRSLKLQTNSGTMGGAISASRACFSALPSPSSWPELQKLVEMRDPDKQTNPGVWWSLRLIVHTLNNAEDRQWADLKQLASVSPPSSAVMLASSGQSGNAFLSVGTALSEVSGQPADVAAFWDATLAWLEKDAGLGSSASSQSEQQMELPDLVTILGQAKAEPILRRALLLPVAVTKVDGLATQNFARKVALDNIDKLQAAPWCLTESLAGAPLYEALSKKFPDDVNGRAYTIFYVIALVTQGRSEEAARADINIDLSSIEEATAQAANAGWGPQVYDFVHAYLGLHPESDLWEFYVELAGQTSRAGEALKFLQETNARPGLSAAAHDQIRSVLYRALLGVDRVDEGIAQLRLLIQSEKGRLAAAPPALQPISSSNLSTSMRIAQALAAARRFQSSDPTLKIVQGDIELARIGHLLKRDALENEGLDDAVKALLNLPPSDPVASDFGRATQVENEVFRFEVETGRYAQAEKWLIDAIVRDVRDAKDQSMLRYGMSFYQTREHLMKLALVYYESGRWPDVITLLDQVPGWGVRDLADVATSSSPLDRRTTPHLDLIAARALAETGRVDEAFPILDYVLQEDTGNDAAYALLLKIGKGDLAEKLDDLYREDQFQERPLIWKAILLLQQGNVAGAESACKAAIAVDPSDGEEGKGDRMRVYSVMADVCDAKKDPQQANLFRNVVKAIRISEDADDYYDAGLLTRAVAMYSQALSLFSDAYCIQSRIARQLADLGRMEEAAVHYRKAFELMPVSFGRLETHCFGCERAFKGKTATDIAEEVFTSMMAKDPQKPQIPYLLGYLYLEEKRYPDALVQFQKAAQLDPDYINAWRHIAEIGDEYQLSPDLREKAVFNLLRLDPAGRHVTPRMEHVRQLDKLWTAEAEAEKVVPPIPKTLLILTAAAAQLPPGTGDAIQNPLRIFSNVSGLNPDLNAWMELQQLGFSIGRFTYHPRGEGASPRDAVLENGVISGALGFL